MAEKSVSALIADIAKRSNIRIGTFSDVVTDVKGLSTGNLAIDYVTGVGGIPVGRITELYGLPSSGKSTTATQTAALLQKKIIESGNEEYILYFDYEHALDKEYSASLGLDVDHPSFILVHPLWLEQGATAALDLIETGKIRLVIWDSVAAMTPKAEMEGDFDQRTSAMNRGRLMAALTRQLNSLLMANDCASLFLNHLMEEIPMASRPGLPPKTTTPGGKGLKYYAALRMEYRQIKNFKGKVFNALTGLTEEGVSSTLVKVKSVKNKVAPPFRETEVRVRFGTGFDEFWSAFQILIAYKVVKQQTGFFYFPEQLQVEGMENPSEGKYYLRGEENILRFADDHADWRHHVIMAAQIAIEEQPPPPAPELVLGQLSSENDELSALLETETEEV